MLSKHVPDALQAAKAKASQAHTALKTGRVEAATRLFHAAADTLNKAGAEAVTKENAQKARPIMALLEQALSDKRKFSAESLLKDLEGLIPADARLAGLRKKVAGLPWSKEISVDLGGGVNMEFVLIPAGEFLMGSPEGQGDAREHPQHLVRISRPFYMGKYEVTQRQWKAVMGENPSHFEGRATCRSSE